MTPPNMRLHLTPLRVERDRRFFDSRFRLQSLCDREPAQVKRERWARSINDFAKCEAVKAPHTIQRLCYTSEPNFRCLGGQSWDRKKQLDHLNLRMSG